MAEPLFALIAAFVLTIACNKDEKKEPEKPAAFDVDLVLPGYFEIAVGENLTLAVKDGKAPLVTDLMQFKSVETGAVTQSGFVKVSKTEVSVAMPKSIVSGQYSLTVKRDSQKKALGTVTFNITEKKEFTPSEGTTVYGKITCDGEPVPGVVVSDGAEVVLTGSNGYYEIKNKEKKLLEAPTFILEIDLNGNKIVNNNNLNLDYQNIDSSNLFTNLSKVICKNTKENKNIVTYKNDTKIVFHSLEPINAQNITLNVGTSADGNNREPVLSLQLEAAHKSN